MFHKKFLKYALFGTAVAGIAAVTAVSCMAEREKTSLSEAGVFAMDTYWDIEIMGGGTGDVTSLLYDLNNAFDRFDPESEVSRLNSGKALSCDTLTGAITLDSLMLRERYNGRVDITSGRLTALWDVNGENPRVPDESEITSVLETIGAENVIIFDGEISLAEGTELDLGAVAKGYALDRMYEALRKTETEYAVISSTSSMLLYGAKGDNTPFRIAVRGAGDGEILGTVETTECFLSTSGGYERYFEGEDGNTYSHILDPLTGYPAETDLTTVTVLCESGILSDYLSTLIYMDGTENIDRHLKSSEYKLIAADRDGNIYVSDGLNFIYENEK